MEPALKALLVALIDTLAFLGAVGLFHWSKENALLLCVVYTLLAMLYPLWVLADGWSIPGRPR